ncbi:MAG: putative sugar nucleotidyl transferase [Candidatus Zixiibacteriota bacterium]
MAKKLFIFEDDKYGHFFPLTCNRPVYELLCGIRRIREKIESSFPDAEVILLSRDHLKAVLKSRTGHKVNELDVEDTDEILLVNGRILPTLAFCEKVRFSKGEKFYFRGDDLVGWTGRGEGFRNLRSSFEALRVKGQIKALKSKADFLEVDVNMANYIWDLVSQNRSEIEADFERIKPDLDFKNMFKHNQVDDQALIYDVEEVYVGKDSSIDGQVVLDAREGPIFIDERVTIRPHTRVSGPCYVGEDCVLVGGKVEGGSSIGPVCRIGGEVEGSIFLGYSNKCHQGFLGHSYVGEWVNLGALTTNSDLKNNYGPVRVMFDGTLVDSGLAKVGAFLGDHVKTGIGTLLNTGLTIGFASNLFGGGMIEERNIPPFSWVSAEKYQEYKLDKAIETAGAVMKRRNVELGSEEIDIFKEIFRLTEKERRKT